MAEYQQIEYCIRKDGTIVETVLNGSGTGCLEATAGLEQALGEVEAQELLPAYYDSNEPLVIDETQPLQQS